MPIAKEVDTFFAERPASRSADPVKWSQTNHECFPGLAKLALSLLCVPATSVPTERVLSAAGRIVTKHRAGLSEENVDALIILQQNRFCGCKVALDEVLEDELPA